MNESGPLERKVDKEFTSDKVYESLLEEEEQRRQQKEEARQRKRRRMPMIENMGVGEDGDVGNNMDGMTVERTTNFSQATKEEDVTDIRLSDKDLFDLLHNLQENKTTADSHLSEIAFTNEEERNENINLLENMKRYSGIPVLMQDTDKSLIGAPQDNVEALKFIKVRMAPDNVQLTFTVESAQEQLINTNQLKEAVVVK